MHLDAARPREGRLGREGSETERESEREGGREGGRERHRETERESSASTCARRGTLLKVGYADQPVDDFLTDAFQLCSSSVGLLLD